MHSGRRTGLADTAQGDYLKYQRAAVAFARFCNLDASLTPEALIGTKAYAAWYGAARRSAKNRYWRLAAYAAAGGLLACAIWLALQPISALLALPPVLPAGWLIGNTMRRAYRSEEPRLEALIQNATPDERDRILNLEEFCNRAAGGRFGVAERLPDGTMRELAADWLKCFAADGGKLLVLSTNPTDWLLIRRRPVPGGEILIDIRGMVAATELSSKTLIDLDDTARFEAIHQWLLDHAQGTSSDATAFRNVLNLIVAFRRPEFAGKGFESKKEELEKEGYSRSMLEKVHSGNYPPFQRFLRSLPLNEIP
ncbi:hypothetical protein C8K11_11216 [Novosphingobium sp. GV055]|nr:hypothetical protein C8K11_11216 [Novosphingobium sp. GV055]PUB00941.1 hypothetical protein C8K12_11216 [Novosphingobium sp. GV061]PUB16474.1 hypothetical protein C8K14_11216 [Novosphingobium sp. GV079]PUB39778.1 hypothetical protein C8K10_11216 [Novosphingobium sp. GV027]